MPDSVKKVYVGNVPENARRSDLQEHFSKFGAISECDIVRDYAFIVSSFNYSAMHGVLLKPWQPICNC